MALLKDLRITESKFVQFRFEFFNVFNHAQFNNPSGSITNANFGKVTSARGPRVGQLAMKFFVLKLKQRRLQCNADNL